LFGLPGIGKSSTATTLISPFRAEEANYELIPTGASIGHVTTVGKSYTLFENGPTLNWLWRLFSRCCCCRRTNKPNEIISNIDLIQPKVVDFVGLAANLLKDENKVAEVIKIVVSLLSGEQIKDEQYHFLLQNDNQPPIVHAIIEAIKLRKPAAELPPCSVALFVFSAEEEPLAELFHIMTGCRQVGIPTVIICTHEDKVTKEKAASLKGKLESYSQNVHFIDARAGRTEYSKIREIWLSVFAACYSR